MTDKNLSELQQAAEVTLTDLTHLRQGGIDRYGTIEQVKEKVLEGLDSEAVAFGANTVSDALGSHRRSLDGIQLAVNSAQPYNTVVTQNPDETVTSLNNQNGVTIETSGGGRVFNSAGVQLSTYAEPKSRFITGEEYLWSIHYRFLNQPSTLRKIVWSGDSTTAGGNAGVYRPDTICDLLAGHYGAPRAKAYNAGHSGDTVVDWNTTHLAADLAAYPDMAVYVLRWGINDGQLSTFTQFRDNLRAGLATLRAAKPVGDLAVILMTPNSTSDTPNGRDEQWYERINNVIRQAARDFQCVYFDTYGFWRDSRANGHAAGAWLDDPYSDGRGIHPDAAFNAQIIGRVCEMIFKPLASVNANRNKITNNISGLGTIGVSVNPFSFHYGISMWRTTDGTFPVDGAVIVHRTSDDLVKQTVIGYSGTSKQVTISRINNAPANTWGAWSGVEINISSGLENGWVRWDAARPVSVWKSEEGLITLVLTIKSGAMTAGTRFLTIPVGYRPAYAMTSLVGACNGPAPVYVSIDTLGRCTFDAAVASNTYLQLCVTYPAAR